MALLDIYMQKTKKEENKKNPKNTQTLSLSILLYTKLNLKWVIGLQGKAKIMTSRRKQEKRWYFGFDHLKKTPKL